jgi:hypothetical protein
LTKVVELLRRPHNFTVGEASSKCRQKRVGSISSHGPKDNRKFRDFTIAVKLAELAL